MRRGSGTTRYWRTSPPMGMTCDDAGHGQKLRAHGEVGELAQRHGDRPSSLDMAISMISPMIDEIGPICAATLRGQLLAHELQPLGDLLAGAVDFDRPVELDVDDGQADAGHRAHARHARHAVHRRLDREGDEQLDLLRREALDLGHQRDGRPVEVGKDVDGQLRAASSGRRASARMRADEHEQPVRKAGANDGVEHGWPSAHLIDELGAFDDDAAARVDAVEHEHVGAVERRHAHGQRPEALGGHLRPTPAAGRSAPRTTAASGSDDAVDGLALLHEHLHRRADDRGRRASPRP